LVQFIDNNPKNIDELNKGYKQYSNMKLVRGLTIVNDGHEEA